MQCQLRLQFFVAASPECDNTLDFKAAEASREQNIAEQRPLDCWKAFANESTNQRL